MKIKKGDMVKVIAGKDKDKEGKVLAVNHDKNTVIVEGVNMITKHTKPSAHLSVFAVLLSPPPAKYEIYIGSIGNRQGDTKVIIPSKNDIKYCIFSSQS